MALLALVAGCSHAPAARVPLTVVVTGDAARATQVRTTARANRGKELDVRVVEPTGAVAPDVAASIDAALADARKAYRLPDVPRCLELLPADAVLDQLLAHGRRTSAARALFWRVACNVAGSDPAEATRVAQRFASLDLEVPTDAEAASPEVEAVLGAALRKASLEPLVRVHVAADRAGALLSCDGRPETFALPRDVSLRPGRHVLHVSANGSIAQTRTIEAGPSAAPGREDFVLAPAPPDVATRQWLDQYATRSEVLSADAMNLLTTAVQARNVALIAVDRDALHGVLAVDGAVRARATSTRPLAEEPALLVHDLLTEGKLIIEPALYQRPLFWIAVGVVAAAAVGTTYYLLRPTDTTARVVF